MEREGDRDRCKSGQRDVANAVCLGGETQWQRNSSHTVVRGWNKRVGISDSLKKKKKMEK